MNAEQIARALGGATKVGKDWWNTKCPAHVDDRASLGLRDTDDGGVAWKCNAGCDKAAVGDALRGRGLLAERPKREAKPRRKMIATYDYRAATGALMLQVVRYEPKDFRQRRPDESGGWQWSIGDIARPLYRLPELLVADPADDVFLVEGEKDVDRLRSLGVTATTTAQGAKGWSKSDHAPLHGRHVVIVPDNDDAGRAYAAQAGRDLLGKVASLRLLVLPGVPVRGDVSDWVDAGGTTDELRHLAAEAPLYNPPPPNDHDTDHRGNGHDRDLAELACLSRLEYDKIRKAKAKELGVRADTLDRAVAELRDEEPEPGAGRTLEWPEPDPWPDQVVGADLLNEITGAFSRFVILPQACDTALALWVLHAHAFEASPITPRLAIVSPEKRCGKTTTLEIVQALTPRALLASNITAAAVFRTIEQARPTLLIDEADTFLPEAEELRGVLNSGHRRTGEVIRTVGDDHEPRRFATWAPVAIAAIGNLPGTLEDRSVKIELKRRAPGETVQRWRVDRAHLLLDVVRRCVRWAADHQDDLRQADPAVPDQLHDRAADNWRPLLAIADAAGGEWPERARKAAVTLSAGDDADTRRTMLLADVKAIFADHNNQGWIATADIIKGLVEMTERPWSESSRGKPINPSALRSLLEPFKVFSTSNGKLRGFKRAAFADAWKRYLPPDASDGARDPSTRQKPNNGAGFGTSSTRQSDFATDGSEWSPNPHERCSTDGLTGQSPEDDGDKEIVI